MRDRNSWSAVDELCIDIGRTMMYWWPILLALSGLWTLLPLPPWIVMFAICLSIFATLKTVVLLDDIRHSGLNASVTDIVGWFFAWPGLNPHDFFTRCSSCVRNESTVGWGVAGAECLFGWYCIAKLAPLIAEWNRLLSGWFVILGLLFLLHFGGFHLLELCWRLRGRSVQPIMRSPLLATSVSDFWSHRWNLAFRDFATNFVLRPLARRWNAHVGLWGCYLFSGLVHELAISAPVRSGYGMPLAYFLLQGLGVNIERSVLGRKLGLRQGIGGRLFAFLVIGPPAFILFHPPFISKLILPLAGISEVTQ